MTGHALVLWSAEDWLPLTDKGKPVSRVIVLSAKQPEVLMMRAAETITGTVRQWVGADLPTTVVSESSGALPSGRAIVLTTIDALRKVAPDIEYTWCRPRASPG